MVLGTSAQTETTVPDYTLIQKNIRDKNSALYYANLYDRYTKADTSMTLEERRHLYYGAAFVSKKNDIEALNKTQVSLREVLKKEAPTKADVENVVMYTADLLKANPFSITIKEYRQHCLKQLGRFEEAKIERAQTDMIIDAILSSGDGTSKQNSIHVIDAGNEFEVVGVLGFEPVGDEYATNGQYDYFTINKNSYNLQGLYFEVTDTKNQVTGL